MKFSLLIPAIMLTLSLNAFSQENKKCEQLRGAEVCVGDKVYSEDVEGHPYYRIITQVELDTYNGFVVTYSDSKVKSSYFSTTNPKNCMEISGDKKICVGDEYQNAYGGVDKVIAFNPNQTQYVVEIEIAGRKTINTIMKAQELKTRANGTSKLDFKDNVVNLSYFQKAKKNTSKAEQEKMVSAFLRQDTVLTELNRRSNQVCMENLGTPYVEKVSLETTVDTKGCVVRYVKPEREFNIDAIFPGGGGGNVIRKYDGGFFITCKTFNSFSCILNPSR